MHVPALTSVSLATAGVSRPDGWSAGAAARPHPAQPAPLAGHRDDDRKLRETFQSVVGQTLYGQLLRSMRKTVGKPAYFHGGRAEEIFQQQLDQILAEKISQSGAGALADPMYELFAMQRK
jgi:hypothetical protein